jgi:hypothetical protein
MRLLLPSPRDDNGVLFYEIEAADTGRSVVIAGFDGRHRVASQADVRGDGEYGVAATLILGENAVSVVAGLSQTGGGFSVVEGTIDGQPFEVLNTPSKPHVVTAPQLADDLIATLAHWRPLTKGLLLLGLALRQYESHDDAWGASPCALMLATIAIGAPACLTAAGDDDALGLCAHAILAANVYLVQGNCSDEVPPLADIRPAGAPADTGRSPQG